MEKEGSYSFSGDCFLGRAENYPLCKAMVDHNQQRIETRGGREVGDKVARDLLEGARGVGFNWGEQQDGGVSVGFVLLACGTAFNVFVHKLYKIRPPKFRGNKLASLEITRVAGGLMVVAADEDELTEGVLWRNVDMTFIGQDIIIVFPVREL